MSVEFSARLHELPGISLFAIEAGRGPAVLLLHGITANAYVWKPVAERLSRSFRVIAVDQRGHGRSGRPAGVAYSAEHYAEDVAVLIDALGLRQALVVGHSLGARNALVAGARYPGKICGVAAIDFTPFIEPAVFDALEARVEGGDRVFSSHAEVRRYLGRRYPLLPRAAIARRAEYGYARNPDGSIAPIADAVAMARTCEGLRAELAPAVGALGVPCLLVRGAASKLVSEVAFEKTAALRPDFSTLVVKSADHYVHEEAPELIAQAVEGFASQAPACAPRRALG